MHRRPTASRLDNPGQPKAPNSEVVPLPAYEAGSNEMIAKLIKAGYLRPDRRHDVDAITNAIAEVKEDLRSGGSGDRRQATA
jgi:hypothetical protein